MKEEWFPLVNEEGETIGKATRKECHSGSKMLHPVVHLHIFNEAGDLYLQKRSMNKDIQPGKWDTAVGGHIDYGETVEEALRREVREELGITDFIPQFITRYVFESTIEKSWSIPTAPLTRDRSLPTLPNWTVDVSGLYQKFSKTWEKEFLLPTLKENINGYSCKLQQSKT